MKTEPKSKPMTAEQIAEKAEKIAAFLSKKSMTAQQVAKQFKLGEGSRGVAKAKSLIGRIAKPWQVARDAKNNGKPGRPATIYSVIRATA